MTDKEILEYSKSIIKLKDEIEAGEAAEPDLDEQIKNKFMEDSVNRAKFIDSALVLGAASKEFRNVFGIDAPHYEIEDCYLAKDVNEDGFYNPSERIQVPDAMREEDKGSTMFSDCWELINASRFDSNCLVSNGVGNEYALPVDKQRFFIDYKKDDESSPLHSPFCPPGFGKWAGRYIYGSICRNYDLNEITLYRILAHIEDNTTPDSFNLDSSFSQGNQFKFNIDSSGKLSRGDFTYSFPQEATSYLANYMNNDKYSPDMPYTYLTIKQEADQETLAGATSDEEKRDLEEQLGTIEEDKEKYKVKVKDSSPVKWFRLNAPIKSITLGADQWYYEYDLTGTPFEKSETPIVELTFTRTSNGQVFNRCIAVLCLDELQAVPLNGFWFRTNYGLRYCANIIWSENDNFYAGDDYEVQHRFLFWSWSTTRKQMYSVTASPINELSVDVKKYFAKFIKSIELDCKNYYDRIKERNISHNIPDSTEALRLINNLVSACDNYLSATKKSFFFWTWTTGEKAAWNNLMSALKQRVVYGIFGTTNVPAATLNKIFDTTDRLYHEVEISYEGTRTFIDRWESSWVPRWPRWLRRFLKWWSTPVYKDYSRYKIISKEIIRNYNFQNTIKRSTLSRNSYLGAGGGDLTVYNGMLTTYQLVNEVMSEDDRKYLAKNKIISRATNPTWIKLDGSTKTPVDNNHKFEIIYETAAEKKPTYDNIARAQVLNEFLGKNEDLFKFAFNNLKDRIDKRTGTLRKTCSLLDSANINSQMIQQQKKNIANLFRYENAYSITSGLGSKILTIKLATWEPYTEAYANLNRLDTVYILSDITTIQEKDGDKVVNKFGTNYVKATITDIIDLVSDTIYNYSPTKDTDVDIKNNIDSSDKNKKVYFSYNKERHEYEMVSDVTEALTLFGNNELYERGTASQGPIFNVKLDKVIPKIFEDRNPRLVKVY